jgi:hypothetical protein
MAKNCSILSQKVPKFELYKHNDELVNIYYGIFYELWTFAYFDLMAAILDTRRYWRTQIWKGTTQGSFQQSLVEIGSVVSEEKNFFKFHTLRKKGVWNLKKFFSSETTEPISTKLCWNDPWVVPFQICVRHNRSK